MSAEKTESNSCPFCSSPRNSLWAEENGFNAVRCEDCGFIFVNPRPELSLIDKAVETGVHSEVSHGRTAINYYVKSKVKRYKKLFRQIFPDIWTSGDQISWLDVGAGHGELLEALTSLAPAGSKIEGVEPMTPKANQAKARGLNVREGYLNDVEDTFDYLSLVNVFSHIPDFRGFLKDVRKTLNPNGELFLETGNTADLSDRSQVPGELDLPDHLVFAGINHIEGFLQEAGFSVVKLEQLRVDDIFNFGKNIIKRLLGRNVILALPYTSQYRSLLIRAKLQSLS